MDTDSMNTFTLDPRLSADCIVLGEMRLSRLLLMNNTLFSWLILVPRRDAIELFELAHEDQLILLEEINHLSRFVKDHFDCEKLNIAAIGNIVKQLHIHVVGRNAADFCWPNVVWGTKEKTPYTSSSIASILESLERNLPTGAFRKTSSDLTGKTQ